LRNESRENSIFAVVIGLVTIWTGYVRAAGHSARAQPVRAGTNLARRHTSDPGVSFLKLDGRHAESRRDGWHKVIRYLTPGGTPERADVYDLESDPGEEDNKARSRAVLRRYLKAELDRSILSQPRLLAASEGVLDPELEERLRTLGYLR